MPHQIEQTPRRGDHDVGAATQTQQLRVDGNAAKHDGDFQRRRQMRAQTADDLANLRAEFARRHQNQGARASGLAGRGFFELLQQRQGKGQRLAGAGLR